MPWSILNTDQAEEKFKIPSTPTTAFVQDTPEELDQLDQPQRSHRKGQEGEQYLIVPPLVYGITPQESLAGTDRKSEKRDSPFLEQTVLRVGNKQDQFLTQTGEVTTPLTQFTQNIMGTLVITVKPKAKTSKSSSSLDNASPFITGYALSTDSIVPPDLSPIPPNYGPSCTESGVVEDFSIRSTTQSIFPPQTDWYGPTGPSTSYMTPVQFDPMISTSRNPHSNTQRPHQDFRLPNYTLDTFLGGFLMSFQAQPSPVVMYKQNFIMPSLG